MQECGNAPLFIPFVKGGHDVISSMTPDSKLVENSYDVIFSMTPDSELVSSFNTVSSIQFQPSKPKRFSPEGKIMWYCARIDTSLVLKPNGPSQGILYYYCVVHR